MTEAGEHVDLDDGGDSALCAVRDAADLVRNRMKRRSGDTFSSMHRRILLAALSTLGLAATLLVAPQTASAATSSIVPSHTAYPPGGTTATGAGIDGANQNAQLADTVPATIVPSWRNAPPLCPQSAGTTASSISVTAASTIVDETGYQCSSVSAYATSTGVLQWRRQYHFARSATVAYGKVFVWHDVPSTGQDRLDALSATTGALVWSAAQGVSVDWRESAGSGLIARSSSVLSAATGRAAFDMGTKFGEHAQTVIAGGRLYMAGDLGAQAFDTKGHVLWSTKYPTGVRGRTAGASGAVPSVHDGLLYTPGTKTTVIDTKTGRVVRLLPSSDQSWAFDGTVGFLTTNGTTGNPAVASTLRAVSLTTGKVLWTHALPMAGLLPYSASTAPVVANGLVWLAQVSDSGSPTEVLALDERTGAVMSATTDACTAGGGDGNLVVAQHRLFVSTGCGVQTYLSSKKAPPIVPVAGERFTDPGFEHGVGPWQALGAGRVSSVTAPVHGGKQAIAVKPTSATPGPFGFIDPTFAPEHIRQGWYQATCWVRPSAPGMSALLALDEIAPGAAPAPSVTGIEVQDLTLGVWTRISTRGVLFRAEDTLALEVTTRNASTAGGSLFLDDCSATAVLPAAS